MKPLVALLLVAPFAAAFPSFYVHDQQYRYGPKDDHCKQKQMCSSEKHLDATGHSYSLNFIEVGDDGKLFDTTQLDAARAQLRAARASGPTIS